MEIEMRHPLRKDRPQLLIICTVGSILLMIGAAVRFTLQRDLDWRHSPIEAIELAISLVLMLGVSIGLAALAVGLLRGPSMQGTRHVSSHEWGAFFGSAMAAGAFTSMALQGLMMLREGDYESWLGTVAGTGFFSSLALFFTWGFVFTLWGLAFRGRSRVCMPPEPVLAGTSFSCSLEIPYAPDVAPAVRARLSLVGSRLESPLNDMAADETIHWSEQLAHLEWWPIGRRRSAATLRFDLPKGMPPDLGHDGTDYAWLLEVEAKDPARPFLGHYLLPIAFQDPYAEGLLADS